METMLTLIHVLIAVLLIGLVLIQDSKGGALGIGGSSTSNSFLGAGGAQTLAAKATVWVAVIFSITCISLSLWTAKKTQSVVSGLAVPAPAVPTTTGIPNDKVPAPGATATAPATSAPAAATAPATTEKK